MGWKMEMMMLKFVMQRTMMVTLEIKLASNICIMMKYENKSILHMTQAKYNVALVSNIHAIILFILAI
jgi:hypothetical protein